MIQDHVWYQISLSSVHLVVGPAPLVTADMVYDTVKKIKPGKAAGSTEVIEMLFGGGGICMKVVVDLINLIIRNGKVPKDYKDNYIISLYKGKGGALTTDALRL